MTPIMDINMSIPPRGVTRTLDGRRDVEEWGLKVQKMASVHSVTLVFVSHPLLTAITTITKYISIFTLDSYTLLARLLLPCVR